MAEVITEAYHSATGVINQCDIFRDIEYIEYVAEGSNSIEVSKIHFPYAIVLTQACDLQQDYDARQRYEINPSVSQDKFLISALVAPLYRFEDFRLGEHLGQLGMQMQSLGSRRKSPAKNVITNENKRYHYLKFADEIDIVESVIDFKHYFSVSVSYLMSIYDTNYVCSIEDLFRENISHRFAHFLSRIGLPNN